MKNKMNQPNWEVKIVLVVDSKVRGHALKKVIKQVVHARRRSTSYTGSQLRAKYRRPRRAATRNLIMTIKIGFLHLEPNDAIGMACSSTGQLK